MEGSRASKNATHDQYCDFDICYVVSDIRQFTKDNKWVEIFGEILIVQYPMDWYSNPYDYAGHDNFAYLIQFKDGNRIDLTLIDVCNIDKEQSYCEPRIVLLNKDNFKELKQINDESVFYIQKPSEMLYIAQMEKGKKIYHYTTIDALINIVKNNELWVTKWNYLNDIDEFKVALDACVEILKEEKIKPEIIQDIVKNVNEDLYMNSLSQDFFVFSFSWDKDSQLLWSNYSNYDGVNLEIDFAKLIGNLNHNILWHGLVNYSFKSQINCLRKIFNDEFIDVEDFGNIKSLNDINRLSSTEYEKLISHMSIICEVYSMFFKRNCFAGEKEYRFVFGCGKKQEISFRGKNGTVIPYIIKNTGNIDYITGIIIGPTNQIDIATKGIRELLHYYQREVDINKSQIPLRF